MMWMGAPSVYVWDCHSAGTIVNKLAQIIDDQHATVVAAANGDARYADVRLLALCLPSD